MPYALLDSNVLVHSAFRNSPLSDPAKRLLDRALREKDRYCIAPQNLAEFAAVATRKRFVNPPLSGSELLRMANILYRSRILAKIYPKRGTVIRTLQEGASLGVSGPRLYDLFLTVTMRDAGVDVIVTDNVDDFRGIPFIRTIKIEDAE